MTRTNLALKHSLIVNRPISIQRYIAVLGVGEPLTYGFTVTPSAQSL